MNTKLKTTSYSCSFGIGVCLFAAGLFAFTPAKADLYLTEFLAENTEGLRDSDGDFSDWIEVFNSGPLPVNLGGYFLTDDETALSKWPFPATDLGPGQFLLVFASEKDRRNGAAELHTNFKIDKEGEYLGLVAPDGITVLSEFGAGDSPLPRQRPDISYGLAQTGSQSTVTLLARDAVAKTHVPTAIDAALGSSWTELGFDDSNWRDALTGIGYDEDSTYVPEFGAGGNLGKELYGINTSLYLRMPFQLDQPSGLIELSLGMKYDDGFAAYLNGTWILSVNSPPAETLSFNSEATASHSDSDALEYEVFDLTEHSDLLLDGRNILSIHGLNSDLDSSDMLISPELVGLQITSPSIGERGFLETPTPAAHNGETTGGFVADTKFNVNRGFFTEQFQLELSSETDGAEIRYTIDGSTPGPLSGRVYRAPLTINRTVVVRAIAYKDGLQPTNVDTHTYLFPSDVAEQSEMRTSITQSTTYGPRMLNSLRAVPSISLITQNSGFLNEGGSNIREEYPASIEMIFPDGREGFQEDAGLSNYGGRFTNFRKKSFRIAFRERFGPTKVRYPIFEGFQYKHHPPAEEFDVINLRSGSHDMNSRGAYMSNRFTDDTMLDMGNIAPHGRFVHVYLNGKYWGQYHMRERWSADMASSYFGGSKDEYEAVNANDNFRNDEEVYDGSGRFWNAAKSLVLRTDPFNEASDHIDIANIIDFMLVWVSGDSESEFRSFGSSVKGVPFKFMIKDADGYLRPASSGKAGHPGPLNVMSEMRGGPGGEDFRMLVADRIHKHFFNDGAFTPIRNIRRLRLRTAEARLGFISESARWGFRSPTSWESYQANLMNNHFRGLTDTMVSRFKSNGMYPDIIAPVFSQHGGSVMPTTPVSMSTDARTVYYTVDGNDPRLPGGVPNPVANVISLRTGAAGNNVSDPLFFRAPTRLRARAYNTRTGEWSALNEALFTIDSEPASRRNLVIAELHYHPDEPSSAEELLISRDRDDYEFIEFLNTGSRTIDLTGVRFDSGINFAFPDNTVLGSDDRLLLLRNQTAFEARYGALSGIQWFEYTGRLSNDGEGLLLTGPSFQTIMDFSYNDQPPWPTPADGEGSSLVLLNPDSGGEMGEPSNWTISRNSGGTPGEQSAPALSYLTWSAGNNLQGGPQDDDDHDAISNFMEFLHGTDPISPNTEPPLRIRLERLEVNEATSDYLVISFQQDPRALGSLSVEVSEDLISWSSAPDLTEPMSQIKNGDGTATTTIRMTQPAQSRENPLFVRLRGE